MEPLGAAASIAQLALLSLNCVKKVHNTLSAIKDGPAVVQLLARDFLSLHDILQQLAQSRFASVNQTLDRHIKQCIEDLCSKAEKIVELQITPADTNKTGRRIWKQLKGVVSENDINRISTEMSQLVQNLKFRIDATSSNAILDLKDEALQMRQQIQSMDDSVQEQLQLQTENLLNNMMARYNEGYAGLQSTLSSDSACILSLLKEIKNHVISEEENKNNTVDESKWSQNKAMLESIDRLCALIEENYEAIDVYSEENELAESVIDDLQTILRSVRVGKHQKLEEGLEKGVRRFGRSFGQNTLSINSTRTKRGRVAGMILDQERTHEEADIGIGRVSLRVHKRKRTAFERTDRNNATSSQGHLTDYEMSVTFLPNKQRNQHMLVASLTQTEILPGSISSISRLQVNRVLPKGSPVFELVKLGKIQELLQMLHSGEASLRDHDECGASLLFYSTKQPEMCKFLLEEGLNVDHVAFGRRSELYNCLQIQSAIDDVAVPEMELKRINACRRLLMGAGADPTYGDSKGEMKSFLGDIRGFPNHLETFDLVWNSQLITPFASFHDWRDEEGMTPFLSACTHRDTSIDTLRRLMAMGANIHDRSNSGETCLHLLLDYANSVFGTFECLIYLLEEGADPYAEDYQGKTPSDVAYNKVGLVHEVSGRHGDIWDAAIHIHGYNIAHFRLKQQRKAIYDWFYTRDDFEKLWKGIEDQCPYWDDQPWPFLKPEDSDPDSVSYFYVSDLEIAEDDDRSEAIQREDESLSSEDEEGGALL